MKENKIIFSWTNPFDDWLVGMEYIPEMKVIEVETENAKIISMFSIGLLICRLDFLIDYNIKEE